MHSLISALFTFVAPIAILAWLIGSIGGHLFKKIDRKINAKISRRTKQ
jgi:hypothetical protein